LPALYAFPTRSRPGIIADEPIACLRVAEAAAECILIIGRAAGTCKVVAAGLASPGAYPAHAIRRGNSVTTCAWVTALNPLRRIEQEADVTLAGEAGEVAVAADLAWAAACLALVC